jgi:hypothetical protein
MTELSQTPRAAVLASGLPWATESDKFMNFWLAANVVLKGREQPEMLYGEARGAFEQFTGRSWQYGL